MANVAPSRGQPPVPMSERYRQRGADWGNAVARLVIVLSVPAGTTLLLWLAGIRLEVPWLMFPWMTAFVFAPAWAWGAWHANVGSDPAHVADDEIGGYTRWPIRRWRSVRLDRLTAVTYFMVFSRGGKHGFIAIRDRDGGRLMVDFHFPTPHAPVMSDDRDRVHGALRTAAAASPYARVGRLTRRRLTGDHPWWAPVRWVAYVCVYLNVAVLTGLAVADALSGR